MKITDTQLNGTEVNFDNGMWFYWQSGGCFEIGSKEMEDDQLIHICSDDLEQFLKHLALFVNKQSKGKFQFWLHDTNK